ncbi:MAG: Zn-dependent protease, partial [Chitinophagaceae bacterium]|nr:Zn-dependent protease [Chitinophagaceae bacterium]
MKKTLPIFFLLFIACSQHQSTGFNKNQPGKKPVVLLQPLRTFSAEALFYLKDSIEKFYPVEVIITATKQFPAHTYYKPRNRYRADSTIKWLKQIKPDSVITIVGLTNEDVSTAKSGQADVGVMGLGYMPGDACV